MTYVYCSVAEPFRCEVHASASDGLIPEGLDWGAKKQRPNHGPRSCLDELLSVVSWSLVVLTICKDKNQHCHDKTTNASVLEEASVLQKN